MTVTLIAPVPERLAGSFVEAPRPEGLDGARVALLANGKTHGEFIARRLAARLADRWRIAEVRMWTKPHPSGPPTDVQSEEIRAFADVVISAIGDCGSCSSCSVVDGLTFERAGIPSAVIISSPFVPTAAAIADINGAERFRVATVAHPVTSRSEADLDSELTRVAADVERILLSGHGACTSPEEAETELTRESLAATIAPFVEALAGDGTGLVVERVEGTAVRMRLRTDDSSCADCVMPRATIQAMLESAIRRSFGDAVVVDIEDDRD